MKIRHSPRLLIFDPNDCILLFKTDNFPLDYELRVLSYWHVPGGGLEPGESFEDAAMRELWEETGIEARELGPCVWIREQVLRFPGELGEALAHERYFPVRVEHTEPVFDNLNGYEVEGISSYRWWTLAALQTIDDVVFPVDLASRLGPIIRHEYPGVPLTIR